MAKAIASSSARSGTTSTGSRDRTTIFRSTRGDAMYVPTDLHGHTLFSDGRATPEEYVDFRRAMGMRVVAISDHDLFAGVRRGAALAAAAGMTLVPAAEITTHIGVGAAREQFHVLAYFPPDVLLGRRLEQTRLYRRGQRVQAKWR